MSKSKFTNTARESTIATHYEALLGDFKRNEASIMAKLEAAEKQAGSAKKEVANAMKDAVDSTEAIRQWEDHIWPIEKLLETNNVKSLDQGLTTD